MSHNRKSEHFRWNHGLPKSIYILLIAVLISNAVATYITVKFLL